MFFGAAAGNFDFYVEGFASKYEFGKYGQSFKRRQLSEKNAFEQDFKQTRKRASNFGKYDFRRRVYAGADTDAAGKFDDSRKNLLRRNGKTGQTQFGDADE